jgi:hypothetical protein
MPNFDQTASDLPTTDKDGNAITVANPLTLGDLIVRQIERSDPVLGTPASGILNSAADSPYNWALLGLFLRDILLAEQIQAIIDAEVVIADATTSEAGIAEIATQTEGRGGTDNERIMTALRVLDFIRAGTGASANTSRRGTVQRATQAEVNARSEATKYVTPETLPEPSAVPNASTSVRGITEIANTNEGRAGTDDERIMTALRVLDFIRVGTGVAATTSRRGTAEIATTTEADTGSDTSRIMTPGLVKRRIDNIPDPPAVPNASTSVRGIAEIATQTEVNARDDSEKIVTPSTLPEPSAVPNASTSVRGIAEIATQSEVNAGNDSEKIVTPSTLPEPSAVPNASTSVSAVRGIAELATQAEVNARDDNSKIVTPATLPEPSAVPNASTSVRGIAEIATQSEVNAGNDSRNCNYH